MREILSVSSIGKADLSMVSGSLASTTSPGENRPLVSDRESVLPENKASISRTQKQPSAQEEDELKELLAEIQKKFDYFSRYLKFEIDREAGMTVVKVIDKKTNEVVRQVPPEYIIRVMKKFDEMLGILIDERV